MFPRQPQMLLSNGVIAALSPAASSYCEYLAFLLAQREMALLQVIITVVARRKARDSPASQLHTLLMISAHAILVVRTIR